MTTKTKSPTPQETSAVLGNYQSAAAVTAQEEAFDTDYLVPGIVGEVGELFGQKAKAKWHGWDADVLQAELVSEYGDVAWMTAILLGMYGVDTVEPFSTRDNVGLEHLILMRSTALHLYYTLGLEEHLPEAAARLWAALEHGCQEITGASFQEVLDNNVDKLAGRVARGTLRGSGDHR